MAPNKTSFELSLLLTKCWQISSFQGKVYLILAKYTKRKKTLLRVWVKYFHLVHVLLLYPV